VPLSSIRITGRLEAGHAQLDAQLTYVNSGSTNPIECTFEFPIERSAVVSKLIASIDDRTVVAEVKEKQAAKEKYDNAIASGNAAVYAQRDVKNTEESITLKLGNLKPGQTAVIDIQVI
jgi:Ca-activated chloride channel family protein